MSGLRRQILDGVAWRSGGSLASQAGALVIGVLLARLLSPAEFGQVAMVTVVTGFVAVLAQLGVGAAVVQCSDLDRDDLSTLFWLSLGAGGLAAAGVAAVAPWLARFYGEPALVPLVLALSLEFAVVAPATVHRALLQRGLEFRSLAAAEVTSLGVGGVLAVALALGGAGVWSLVARALVASALRTAWLWRASRFRPRLRLRRSSLAKVRSFSAHLLGTQSLTYWTRNLDSLLVARFLGVDALGLYNRAYALLLRPLAHGSQVVGGVLFPSLSKIRGEPERVRAIFLRAIGAVALLSFPLNLGLVAVMDAAVPALLGPQWLAMVPLARLFCLIGLVQSLSSLNGSLYLSQGRTDLQLRYGTVFRLTGIAGIVAGLPWGVMGVASGYGLATALVYYPNTRIATGLVGLRFRCVSRQLLGVLACAAAMAAAVFGLGAALGPGCSDALRLTVQVPTGAALYLALLALFRVRAFTDTTATLRAHLAERSAPRTTGGAGLSEAGGPPGTAG
jgi:PST family polysaccharide transporter